ncbi:MAG: outer membrane protein, partial [Verrucomicrobiota bacterium]
MKKSWSELAAIFTLAGAFHAQSGTVSYQAIPATQSDANCGITDQNHYTTAVDGGNTRGTARVINGITLDTLSGNGQTSTADNCTLNALSGSLANQSVSKSSPADGTFKEVMSDMTVNNGAGDNSQQEVVIDPASLEAGVTYDLRLYVCNSSGQSREVNLAFFGDGQDAAETGFFNEDDARTTKGGFKDRNQVYYINYRYTWDGDSTPGITITQQSGSAAFCFYALTNQVVPAEGAAAEGAAAGSTGNDPGFAFVDMNKIFKDYGKTKGAEAKINDAKNDAKKKYDERADAYKKALDEINELNHQIDSPTITAKSKTKITRDRDKKITAIKEMEREINEWRKTRERSLQEQALKMREEIVAEITATINQLGGETNAILDINGLSLNGVPFVVHYPATADMTERVTSALNGGQSSPFSSAHNLKIALVNMNEVFKQFNKTKASEAQINEGKAAAKKEYDEKAERYKKELADVPSSPGTARDQQVARVKEMEHDINEWRAAREKGVRDQALKMREEIVAEITKEIKARVVA